MPGTLGHLSSRFFDVLLARPLDPAELATVDTWLTPPLAAMFRQQQPADQRHGYEAGLTVLGQGGDADMILTAAMHDMGKRHARLGILGRTVASLLIKIGAPLTPRMTVYRDHGLIAAKELANHGAPGLAVDFALHHHGERPPSIAPEVWETLVAADQPKPRIQPRRRISSGAA